eukprot:SAG31_NODE_2519_length_5569_cov_4.141316_1_plen_295_part_00
MNGVEIYNVEPIEGAPVAAELGVHHAAADTTQRWRPMPVELVSREFFDCAESMGEMWGAGPPTNLEMLVSDEERDALATLAARYAADGVSGAAPPDRSTLLKFLRARRLDVHAAHEQLKEERLWRVLNSIDTILVKPDRCQPVFSTTTAGHAFHGFSKQGHPVYYERSGDFDVSALVAQTSRKQIALRHVWYMEVTARRMASSATPHGRPVTRQVEVRDLANLSLVNFHIFVIPPAVQFAYSGAPFPWRVSSALSMFALLTMLRRRQTLLPCSYSKIHYTSMNATIQNDWKSCF